MHNDALARATALLERGFSVIPIEPPSDRHDGKKPAIPWGEFQRRQPTAAELRQWFASRPAMNIGIVTGAVSGIVVVDVDSASAFDWVRLRLPRSGWQTQTSRGFHIFYKHAGGRVGNGSHVPVAEAVHIDVRGDGGYVIAPGSRHQSGFVYAEAGDWSAARESLPYFWPGWVARPRRAIAEPPAVGHQRVAAIGVIDRARRYLSKVPVPEIGSGSDEAAFVAACRLLRGFDLTASDTETLLWEWAGHRPGWSRRWLRAKIDAAARYGTEAVGAMRR